VAPAITTTLDTLTRIMVIQPMTIRAMDIPATTTVTLDMWVAESALGLTSTSSEDTEYGEAEAAITVAVITVVVITVVAITEADLTVAAAPTLAESLVATAAAATTTFAANP
jgi:hypothetical protein